MADLDLLLVNPGSRLQIYQGLGSSLAAIEPPVWAGLMASYVRGRGYSVEILDANAEDLAAAETAERVETLNPRLTAIVVYGQQPSASTQLMPSAGAIATAIKRGAPQSKVLFVGGHVASLPEHTLREEQADFVALGEGLHTITDLIDALGTSAPDYAKVRGLLYWDGKEPRTTASGPLVTDLDNEMPGVAWDLLPMSRYRAHNWHCFGHLQRQPYASLYTTLGCPYHCSYCCIQAPFKTGEQALGYKPSVNSYRFWSPDAVGAQLETLVTRYGVRNIKFADEMFVLNPRHVLGICDLIIERGYDLNIWAYARVDTIKPGMAEKLKRAGFHWLCFGIEAGHARVRDDVNKSFTQQRIFAALDEVRQAGINVIGNYIFGLPEDDLASMQETLDLALALRCEFANFYSAMAYPGSDLYRYAQHQGWALPNSWSGYSQHSVDTLPLPTKHISAADVLRFRDDAFRTYFTDAAYLADVARKFGADTARHIAEMASHTLERQYA
jgi:anaerobic magnesium-protoporphyrin IX monomethyl ester cyclase